MGAAPVFNARHLASSYKGTTGSLEALVNT